MKVTTGYYNPNAKIYSLSDSKVWHDTDSAIKLLVRRGYSHDAACKLLVQMKYAAR